MSGAPAAGDLFSITVGAKVFSYTAPASPTAASVAAGLAATLQALSPNSVPEITGIAVSYGGADSLTLTGQPGTPFDFETSLGPGNSGSGAVAWTDTTPASGPNFANVAANWSGGVAPQTGDAVYLTNSAVSLLHGLDMSSVQLAALYVDSTFTGFVGLPRNRGVAGGVQVAEYLPQYWRIGVDAASLSPGSGRFKLDTGAAGASLFITGAGSPAETGVKSILWIGSGVNNISISKGSFAAANFAGETATIHVLNQEWQSNQSGDTDVRLGAGCTATTISKTGGALEVNSGVAALTQNGAGQTTLNAGAQGAIAIYGAGSLLVGEIVSYTSLTVGDNATADFRRGGSGLTGTSTSLNGKYKLLDPGQRVTFTNPIGVSNPDAAADIDFGANYSLQRS